MLKNIRNLNFGWIIVLVGFVIMISGISMSESKVGDKTFLCFDRGCIVIQGISNIALGLFSITVGIYLIVKNHRNRNNN